MKIKKIPFIRMSVICLMMLAIVAAVMPAIHAQEAALRTTAQENGTEVVRFDYQGEDISVKVTLKDPADLPEDAQMSVTPVTITQALQSKLDQEANAEEKAITSAKAYDITFTQDGVEVQPGATVKVTLTTPDVKAGDDAAVYHVTDEETAAVEKKDAVVEADGTLAFDADHFSTYVVVNTSEAGEIKVSINRYCYLDENGNQSAAATGNTVKLYQSTNTLAAKTTDAMEELKFDDQLENYRLDKVEMTKGNGIPETVTSLKQAVAEDTTFDLYYTTTTYTTYGDATFYDYTKNPVGGGQGILNEDNYTKGIKKNLTVGNDNTWLTGLTSIANNIDANKWTTKPNSTYTEDEKAEKYSVKNIVKGLDDNGEVVFNSTIDEPGFFTNSLFRKNQNGENGQRITGKDIYTGYDLQFERTGDSYSLNGVVKYNTDSDATAKTNGASIMNTGYNDKTGYNFFPLDHDEKGNSLIGEDSANNQANSANGDKQKHNDYLGLRYDVDFKLNDYVGPLSYRFSGDDDLWVILDGKTLTKDLTNESEVIIDLGGIHDTLTKGVDLWEVLKTEYGIDRENVTEEQKNQTHTLTILYMERGANVSNCSMKFTLPNVQISEVTNIETAILSFNKVDGNNAGIKGAGFTLTNDNNANETYTALSDENGMVSIRGLLEGTYTLTETKVPGGYMKTGDSWKVIVIEAENGKLEATLYQADRTTPITDIINYNIRDSIQMEKTAALINWDSRQYKIDLSAFHVMVDKTLNEVTLQDYIDSRFDVTNEQGEVLKDGANVSGGTLHINGDTAYIEWTNQSIIHGETWHQAIYLKAKEGYIGGNNVTTNDDSKGGFTLKVGEITKMQPSPTVNVKVDLLMNNLESTIFYGDTIQADATAILKMYNTEAPQGRVNGKVVTYTNYDKNKLHLQWFSDADGQTKIENLTTIAPEKEATYYLKVTYDTGESTQESYDNSNRNIAGNALVNTPGTATATNSGKVIRGEKTFDTDLNQTTYGQDLTYGVYKIHVVKGQIQINKKINSQYSNIEVQNANQTFIYKVERFEKADDPNVAETFYETISFDANGNATEDSRLISGLKKGYYKVTEESQWSKKYELDSVVSEGNSILKASDNQLLGAGITIGTREGEADENGKYTFSGLVDAKSPKSSATQWTDNNQYQPYANGKRTHVSFVNKNTNWNWLSDTASAINVFK